MTRFFALLKMEYKNKKQLLPIKNKVLSLFLKGFLFLLKNFVYIFLLVLLSQYLLTYAIANTLENDLLIIIVLFAQVLQFFVALNQILKSQQNSKEIKELLMVPARNEVLYLSKIVYLYLKQLMTYILVLSPVLITWGVMTAQGIYFYLMLLPVLALLPIIPLLLASVASFPMLKFTSFLKSNFYVNFILFSLIIAVGFYYYIELLKVVIELFQNQGVASFLSLTDIAYLQNITSKIYISVLFKNILTGSLLFKSLLVMLSISLFCFLLVFYLAKKYYRKLMWGVADSEINYGFKNTKLRKLPLNLNLLLKEFKTVFRNYNHSFSFFTIGLATPLIVFLSSKALSEFSFAKTNISIYPPLSLFLLLIFITLTTSFSATTITREGQSFLLTKSLPIKAKRQVKVKMLFYMIIEFVAVFVSVFALYLANLISVLDFVLIVFAVLIIVYGGICSSINLDIKNPKYKDIKNSNSALTNINVSKSMSGGLMLAFTVGFLAITLSFILENMLWYIPVFVIGLSYAIFKHIKLFKKLEIKYNEIEI